MQIRSVNQPPAVTGPSRDGRTASAAPPVVLVVDRDPVVVAAITSVLAWPEFEVVGVGDVDAALRQCAERRLSIAIVECDSSDQSGVELLECIGAHGAIPVICLSEVTEEAFVQAAAAGATAYLAKPLDMRVLPPVIKVALQRHQELHALRQHIEKLRLALDTSRNINAACGLLMARFCIGFEEAFGRLRRHARSQRVRIEELALELLRATNETARLYGVFGQGLPAASPDDPASTPRVTDTRLQSDGQG